MRGERDKGNPDYLGPTERMRWVQTAVIDLVQYVTPADKIDENDPEARLEGHGDSIRLFISDSRPYIRHKKSFTFNLTHMTVEEVDAVANLFAQAFADARVIAEKRDKIAEEKCLETDEVHPRYYRQVPHVVDRTRGKRAHRPGVPDGPEAAPQ